MSKGNDFNHKVSNSGPLPLPRGNSINVCVCERKINFFFFLHVLYLGSSLNFDFCFNCKMLNSFTHSGIQQLLKLSNQKCSKEKNTAWFCAQTLTNSNCDDAIQVVRPSLEVLPSQIKKEVGNPNPAPLQDFKDNCVKRHLGNVNNVQQSNKFMEVPASLSYCIAQKTTTHTHVRAPY